MQKINFKKALINRQWQDDVSIEIGQAGIITRIAINDKTAPASQVKGYALPAMPNIHSHAFQRAMAGLAEYSISNSDSFWSWRDVMYRFAQRLAPEDLFHIARQLYLEMIKAGYGAVAEFHYLHHQMGGKPYADPAEMSQAIITAARDVGISLTHLPVLYMTSGFGGLPLSAEQARFGHSIDRYCHLLDQLYQTFKGQTDQRPGVAFHSLRAVPPEAITDVITHLNGLDDTAPIHIHIAEQVKEVEDCLNWSGQRPVEWLLDHQDIDHRWCLIHATHLSAGETTALANSGAVVGICPTTEGNLGDGIFPLKDYLDQGGRMAIGSDSHVSISPIEELRLLEYGQRLKFRGRNIAITKQQPHSGSNLYMESLKGGALATGFECGAIEVGKSADIITLDPESPLLLGTPDKYLLDRFIFSGNVTPVNSVMTRGEWLIKNGAHKKEQEILTGFRNTVERLAKILD